ncbi:hypothetical protein JCM8547_002287 [Rhodosporidiobolus lusitaniae]
MCLSIASLVYGIPVRTSSLIFAAEAWPRLEKTLPFFDLVSLRISRGTLKVERQEGEAAVSLVPVEVWEMVKDEVVKIELWAAEMNFVKRYFGGEVLLKDEEPFCDVSDSTINSSWPNVLDNLKENCYWCWEGTCAKFNAQTEWSDAITRLVRRFGFAVPPDGLFRVRDGEELFDVQSATFIHLSSVSSALSDADHRLRHFIQFFRLETLVLGLRTSSPDSRAIQPLNPTLFRSFEPVERNEVQPSWHLLTTRTMY